MAPHQISDVIGSTDRYEEFTNGGNTWASSNGYTSGISTHSHEPIAIIGMGCRLPGGAASSSKLWDMLAEGRSGQCKIPASRFNVDGFYHPNVDRPGSMNTTGGYFLEEDIRAFENSFFGINNLEATFMDPQQRKLLEVVFECFESAGAPLQKISGANIGCYVGNFTTDFQLIQGKDSEYLHRYSATGMGTTILANRISHAFNLQGPSFVLDTACSSSLYCLHVACAALDAGECDSAIAAGANLVQSPEQHLGTMKAGVLSRTSTCHTFDSSADGYGRADGIGALYLKRLGDAIRDGDPIRSVIRGTAVNSNGKTPGITLPSAAGQEAVIRKAYAKAGLGFDNTQYVECHGTGTAVGDPIEVEGIANVFKRPKNSPLLIGSVKTNLGHSEAASGISSIIKVTLALERGEIPPTIGVKNINPKIKIVDWNVKIVTETTTWPDDTVRYSRSKPTIRRAGINSFGYGGANAHAILEAAESHVPEGYWTSSEILARARTNFILPFSANSQPALKSRVSDLASIDLRTVSVVDLAYTLGVRRSNLPVRGFLLAGHKSLNDDLRPENLQVAVEGGIYSQLPIAFVFTGQGAQWPEMGRALIEEFPTFRRSIQQLDSVLQLLPQPPTWTLQGAILEPAETSKIHHASRSQPVCTALQIALVQLLAEWGIKAHGVIGHSSGEIGAAYVSGQLTAAQAIVVAFYRGQVVTQSTMQGAMMAAGLNRETANSKIQDLGLEGKIRVACVNSPESVTISGDTAGIDQLLAHLQEQGAFARKLKTDGRAYHSHHMAVLGQEYEDLLVAAMSSLPQDDRGPSDVRFVSSVTGELVTSQLRPAYWRANLESPVLFSDAVEGLAKDHDYHLIEIGPHSALELPIKQTRTKLHISESKLHYSSTLSRGKNSVSTILSLIGNLYLHGHDISFEDVNHVVSPLLKSKSSKTQGKLLVDLPNYQWQYDSTLWNESRVSVEFRNRKYQRHDLLGSQVHGGNGVTITWRNMLKVKDVPWLEDHKLDQMTVFPGAGYVAMAIEAVCQATNTDPADLPAFGLRHVNILKALVLSDTVELFTAMQPAQISVTTSSEIWWQFDINSYNDGIITAHASGLICIEKNCQPIDRELHIQEEVLEQNAVRSWYDKFAKEGLKFGKSFQSLTEIRNHRKKELMQTVTKTEFLQGGGEGVDRQSAYIVHPITIDALLQTAIIASTSGVIKDLKAKVPVIIEHARIQTPAPTSLPGSWNINAVSEPVGFETIKISAELYNARNQVCVQLKQVRAVVFQGAAQTEPADERHPMLRVLWKPDLARLLPNDTTAFPSYVKAFGSNMRRGMGKLGSKELAGALDLVSHKNPRLRVLELGNDEAEVTESLLDLLRYDTPFKRCKSFAKGHISDDQELVAEEIESTASLREQKQSPAKRTGEKAFDVIILPNSGSADSYLDTRLEQIKNLLVAEGILLSVCSSSKILLLEKTGFSILQSESNESSAQVVLARRSKEAEPKKKNAGKDIVLVERNSDHTLNDILESKLSDYLGHPISRIPLEKVSPSTITAKATVVSTIELKTPILSTMSNEEMSFVKIITDNASNLLWITGGGLLKGSRPDFALVNGLSRSLMLEQPSLKFFTLDIDDLTSKFEESAQNVLSVLKQAIEDPVPDFEFMQHDGTLHVSRFVPEETLNRTFRQKQGSETVLMPLEKATPCKLSIESVGQFDSIYFTRQVPAKDTLKPGFVEVDVKSVGLNAKDLYVLAGKVDTKDGTCTLEYSGVVTKVGAGVSKLAPNDRVVVMAPGHFQSTERVPEWACHKLKNNEDFNVVSTIPMVYTTALYALHHRAHIQPGESVLIHSGAGGLGIAAIQIAQLVGTEIFATVGTEAKKDFLEQNFGLKRENIFSSRDSSFLPGILAATNGRGVDVVLNSLTGDLLHDSWRACANFGRFVEVGKRDISDAGKLDMEVFSRNVTFTAFDMSNLYDLENQSYQRIRETLLTEAMSLYRDGKITAIEPLRVFDISEVTQAFRHFSSGTRIGKVAVSLENPESSTKVLPLKHDTTFSPDKSYFLVGCLGGLGRSISKWMVKRGARKFVFLGRTGIDRPPARQLVEDLEQSGAQVTVARGDVGTYADVEKAVAQIEGPIGGVIQAAMGLDEALFTTMSREYWHTGITPKLVGSWNLHNAIKGKDSELEFFMMTSSISGSVGTATESNYCSANYFLDVFARYRRSLGLPAMSIGLGMISEVGYLHENPEIEALLLRKGIQAINEDELLQIVDVALSTPSSASYIYDDFSENHILTGLEPLGLKELRKKGFEGETPTLNDPRASLLANALATDAAGGTSNSGLPAELAKALESGASVFDTVLGLIAKKFSNFILVPLEKLEVGKPLALFGMDSMLAAEFRTWFYQAFKVDIAFLTLLSKTVTIQILAESVTEEVLAAQEG